MDIIEMFENAAEYEFLFQLVILLISAAIGGWIASLIKMPPVLGQILVGIFLGPTVLDVMRGEEEFIHIISQIGVIFLMFLAGLETDLKELKSSGKGASMIALGGVVVPMTLGTLVPFLFFKNYLPAGDTHHQLMYALFIGTILTATSVSVSVSVLRDMKQLTSRQGISILGGAIIDDVLGIILLAIISGMISPSGDTSVGQLVFNMGIYFFLAIIACIIIAKGITKFAQGSVWRDRIITFAIILCFLFAFSAEMFNVAAITGAYFAGVALAATPYRHRIVNKVQSFAYALFTPIFFVSIGLSAEISSDIIEYIGYACIIVAIAVFGKIIGCGLGAKVSGFSNKHSIQVGVGMIVRAEVALIVANQGMRSGIITNETFTSIVLLVVSSTIITPPLLKYLFKGEQPVEVCINEID